MARPLSPSSHISQNKLAPAASQRVSAWTPRSWKSSRVGEAVHALGQEQGSSPVLSLGRQTRNNAGFCPQAYVCMSPGGYFRPAQTSGSFPEPAGRNGCLHIQKHTSASINQRGREDADGLGAPSRLPPGAADTHRLANTSLQRLRRDQ